MLLVKWRPQALDALAEILDYIEQSNPAAAASLHHTILTAVEGLSSMPYSFKSGRVPEAREMVVHPNYVVVYQVVDYVDIVTVLHARQQYP